MAAQASNLKIVCFFLLWYVLNVMYNESNMTVLKVLGLPWSLAALQLGLGLLYVVPKWATGLGKVPRLSQANLKAIAPIAMIHGAGQCVTVLACGAGSLAFVNVVKSLEPLFNTVFAALLMGDVLPWQVNACLLPVILGVGIASATDLSFTWECFGYAMGSNLAYSLRGVLSKRSMAVPKGEHMDAGNMFAVLNTLAFLAVLPVALALEGPVMASSWERAVSDGPYTRVELVGRVVASGLSFYLYNEVAFYTLEAVHPITHAVGNTVKRVILILFSVARFGTPMTTQSAIGSAIAVTGVFAYSVAKNVFKPAKPAPKSA
uniref:Sugar phosphate transporter domain-containing protein n=1 Tax=Phaeocystis antarctica TaxID=33657 RepID=A0A7S0DYK3_9EUKA